MSGNIERMTIALTSEMSDAVKGAVESGEYASNSEVIREALRDWRLKRMAQHPHLEQLRADVQAGLDDIPANRVRDFDPERIIEKGKQKRSARSSCK